MDRLDQEYYVVPGSDDRLAVRLTHDGYADRITRIEPSGAERWSLVPDGPTGAFVYFEFHEPWVVVWSFNCWRYAANLETGLIEDRRFTK